MLKSSIDLETYKEIEIDILQKIEFDFDSENPKNYLKKEWNDFGS